jgi:Ca2+-binding RTX toxin-like protein
VRRGRLGALLAGLVLAALVWPVVGLADHILTSATVSARLKAKRSVDFWTIEIRWTAGCQGAAAGKAWYEGDLFLVDAVTGERIYAGGVVDTSGSGLVSGTREWYVASTDRERTLFPELTIHCYENFPLHGGREVVVTGASAIVPPRFGGGGGPGGAEGDYGAGDPTGPLGAGGCTAALVGTSGRDTLAGGGAGDVIFGLAGADTVDGRGGHDCLIGGSGNDVLRGHAGSDRLTGGRGDDTLVGGPGVNAYQAGPGRDFVDARNGKRERVSCGSGVDRARVDRSDRVAGCERVSRPA